MKYLLLFLLFVSSFASALVPKDLNDGDVIAQGVCQMLGDYYHCIYIEKNGKNYIAVGDGRRLRSIYSVKEWKETYTPDEMTLEWALDMTQEKAMYVYHQKGDATILFEMRLCAVCCRIFNLNTARYHHFVKDKMIFYAHERCPKFKEPPLQLERRK